MEENGARRCTTAMFCGRTGLLVLMTGYAFLGALLFKALEGGNDGDVPVHVQRSREDCLRELWLITVHNNTVKRSFHFNENYAGHSVINGEIPAAAAAEEEVRKSGVARSGCDVLGEVEGALLASPGSFRPLATIRRTDVANNRVHVAQTVIVHELILAGGWRCVDSAGVDGGRRRVRASIIVRGDYKRTRCGRGDNTFLKSLTIDQDDSARIKFLLEVDSPFLTSSDLRGAAD
ncbi:hypothetical protein GEV33_014459 [Tenebrio molitor]|uniref:Uncharacterized protein n=1 Tax=Tenebrio molitor TaxID=7067 RepID=A0A8J6GY90_TENMO|nr:hypothetical protein GEV33_014459 [Tenebrio molitor]